MYILAGLLIPFLGTALGAGSVFFLKKDELKPLVQKALPGFASGVMVAASVWSLLIPAMDASSSMGKLAFLPAAVGFALGILFLLGMDRMVPHLHLNPEQPEGPGNKLKKTTMLVLAVTLHNIPEGMAVGVVFAGLLSGEQTISRTGALALSLGIAIQNFPEGAAISLPLYQEGMGKGKSFLIGAASGVVEPVFALLTVLVAGTVQLILPWLLSFAAGAMLYVVVEELIPEANLSQGGHSGTLGVMAGFLVMMILDVALG